MSRKPTKLGLGILLIVTVSVSHPLTANADVVQTCSNWEQVSPGVLGKICIGESNGQYSAFGAMWNNTGRTVSMEESGYLVGRTEVQCAQFDSFAPPGKTMHCQGNWTWQRSPHQAYADFRVDGINGTWKRIYTPVLS
jgi:hypothetical protein